MSFTSGHWGWSVLLGGAKAGSSPSLINLLVFPCLALYFSVPLCLWRWAFKQATWWLGFLQILNQAFCYVKGGESGSSKSFGAWRKRGGNTVKKMAKHSVEWRNQFRGIRKCNKGITHGVLPHTGEETGAGWQISTVWDCNEYDALCILRNQTGQLDVFLLMCMPVWLLS